MFSIAEFDMGSLACMTREQAELMGAAGKLSRGLGNLCPAIAAVLERYSSVAVKLRVLSPVSVPDLLVEGVGPGFEGVAASIRCIDPPARVFVLVPGTLCERLARGVLALDGIGAWDSPEKLEAIMLYLGCDVLRAMPASVPVSRLESVTSLGMDDEDVLGGPLAVLYVKVRSGGHNDLVTLLTSPGDLHALARGGWIDRLVATRSAAASIETTVAVVVGSTMLELEALGDLRIGDVATIDRQCGTLGPAGPANGCRAQLAAVDGGEARLVVAGRIRDGRFVVGPGGPAILEGTMSDDAEHTTVDTEAADWTQPDSSRVRALAGVPTQVVVEAGRVSMKVGELLSMTEGTVIPLEKPASGEVTLSVGGRPIAHGVLAVVDGELGVRILSVLESG
jgi:type III secretion system YscQ/HrcQ family protein